MPLSHGKSAKTFSKNVSTEMHEGKPLKQSLAIAYAMKKKAKKARGGDVHGHEAHMCHEGCHMWEGGRAEDPEEMEEAYRPRDKDHMPKKETAHSYGSKPVHDLKGKGYPSPKGNYMLEKKKHMADGGDTSDSETGYMKGNPFYNPTPTKPEEKPKTSDSDSHASMEDSFTKSLKANKRIYHPGNYAEGGEVGEDEHFIHEEKASGYLPMPHPDEHHAEQGLYTPYDSIEPTMNPEDEEDEMIASIMHKLHARKMSKGGRVANDVGDGMDADKKENEFDDLVLDDGLEEHYTGKNSGDEIGDEAEDEDRHDIVSQIMKSRKKKDKLPHPM